ncbi:hypothetical protein [Mycobacteroides abscessus]|uniref:hypothetical protein n=1 Tax=Mycobacteroides abscessus TaxID=36809 RepID=UPI0009A7052D|nr:hypothetical protein [Mycobacteroides abscessus]
MKLPCCNKFSANPLLQPRGRIPDPALPIVNTTLAPELRDLRLRCFQGLVDTPESFFAERVLIRIYDDESA